MSKQEEQKQANSRRKALKAITAASGGIVAAKWSKPVVDSVVLPAHAQTSPAAPAPQPPAPQITLASGGGGSGATASATATPINP